MCCNSFLYFKIQIKSRVKLLDDIITELTFCFDSF